MMCLRGCLHVGMLTRVKVSECLKRQQVPWSGLQLSPAVLETDLKSSEEQRVRLTSEPSLQPLITSS